MLNVLLAGERSDLAGELTGAEGIEGRLAAERVAQRDVDAAAQHHPGRRGTVADAVDGFARREGPRVAAGEALDRLDLRRTENRKNLIAARLGHAHCNVLYWLLDAARRPRHHNVMRPYIGCACDVPRAAAQPTDTRDASGRFDPKFAKVLPSNRANFGFGGQPGLGQGREPLCARQAHAVPSGRLAVLLAGCTAIARNISAGALTASKASDLPISSFFLPQIEPSRPWYPDHFFFLCLRLWIVRASQPLKVETDVVFN